MKAAASTAEFACNLATSEEAYRFEEMALDALRKGGFRITMTRVQVIRTLAESNRAMSAYQIHERIRRAGGKIDVVSVYRILSTLQELGIVHHIGVVDGYYACRHPQHHDAHSEHLVCEECGCVVELGVPKTSSDAVQLAAERAGFRVHEMKIEVLGTCSHCARRA